MELPKFLGIVRSDPGKEVGDDTAAVEPMDGDTAEPDESVLEAKNGLALRLGITSLIVEGSPM